MIDETMHKSEAGHFKFHGTRFPFVLKISLVTGKNRLSLDSEFVERCRKSRASAWIIVLHKCGDVVLFSNKGKGRRT